MWPLHTGATRRGGQVSAWYATVEFPPHGPAGGPDTCCGAHRLPALGPQPRRGVRPGVSRTSARPGSVRGRGAGGRCQREAGAGEAERVGSRKGGIANAVAFSNREDQPKESGARRPRN